MALVVTLDQLRADALLWADARPGGANEFVGTVALDRLINLKISQWQDLILASRPPDQPASHVYIVATPGTATLTFASNLALYSIITCEILWNGTTIVDSTRVEPVKQVSHADAYKLTSVTWGEGCPKGYTRGEGGSAAAPQTINSDVITIYPTPRTAARFFFRFIPGFIDLVASPGPGHQLVTWNQWDKFIAIGVGIEILAIQGRKSDHLAALYQEEQTRLQTLASERLTTDPKQIRDVYPESPWGVGNWVRRLPPP
jgi:hypothetical protein